MTCSVFYCLQDQLFDSVWEDFGYNHSVNNVCINNLVFVALKNVLCIYMCVSFPLFDS